MFTNLTLPELTIADNSEKTWMVIHTKSRREKKVALHCNNSGVKYYLPIEKKIRLYGKRKTETILPLFPGYLFCLLSEKERYHLLLTHQIAKVLKVSNQLKFLNDIEKIFIAEEANYSLIPCKWEITGKMARIESGPMKGFEGIISQIKGKERIIINVNFINSAAACDISRSDVIVLN